MPTVEFIQIEATTRCNFSCAFCPGRHLKQGDIAYNLFEQILNEFNDIRYIQLYGEGEPLIHPSFFRMVKLASCNNITVSTITNGSLLGTNFSNIITSGLHSLHVSLESVDSNTFRNIRGGNLSRILESIALLINIKKSKESATPFVGLSVTVLKETMSNLNSIFRQYQDLSLDGGIIIQPLNEMSSYTQNYSDSVHHQVLNKTDIIRINKALECNEIFNDIQKNKLLKYTYFESLRENFNIEQDGCPWLNRSLFINFMGFAMPCSMIKDVKQYSFGNIGEDTKQSVLKKREIMRRKMLEGDTPEACKNCRTLDSRYKPGIIHQHLDT